MSLMNNIKMVLKRIVDNYREDWSAKQAKQSLEPANPIAWHDDERGVRQTGRTTKIVAEFLVLHEENQFDRVAIVAYSKRVASFVRDKIIHASDDLASTPQERNEKRQNLPKMDLYEKGPDLKEKMRGQKYDYMVIDHPFP